MKRLFAVAITLKVLVLTACPAPGADPDEMYALASSVMDVSSAVQTYARYGGAPEGLQGPDLVARATAHNPAKLEGLKGYYVTARRVGEWTSVLVCDAEGGNARLEDAACTMPLDAHVWQDRGDAPCDFVLDLEAVCTR